MPSGTKHPFWIRFRLSSGFGGDPNNYAKLDFSKGKLYEFSGVFRRDRSTRLRLLRTRTTPDRRPYGMVTVLRRDVARVPRTRFVLFNTVRRMTDTNLTVLPLSKVRSGRYSQNIFRADTQPAGRSANTIR